MQSFCGIVEFYFINNKSKYRLKFIQTQISANNKIEDKIIANSTYLILRVSIFFVQSLKKVSILIFNNFIMANSQEGTINISEIPKFQFEVNNDELKSCIKQMTFQLKTQDKNIMKMKKDIEQRTSESTISQLFIMMTAGIQIDTNLVKLLRTKQVKKDESNPLRNSATNLGRKINQIAQCLPIIMTNAKNLQKRVIAFENQITSIVNQKTSSIQQQLYEFKSQQMNENTSLSEKFELSINQFSNKIRQVQTKTLWQINDCKSKLEDRVNQQFVRDAIKEIQGKMMTKIKEAQMKSNIDPERINKIDNKLSKIQKQFAHNLTECSYRITALSDHIEEALMTKKGFAQQRLDIEKRLSQSNTNFSDMFRRVKNLQAQTQDHHNQLLKNIQFKQQTQKQVKRVNNVLNNLKIGDDFQKMLQKMDPHKICSLDAQIDNLKINQLRYTKELEILKRQVEKLRAKNQFVGLMTPNAQKQPRFDKQEIGILISQFFVNNQFARKIQNMQAQLLQTKSYNQMINDLNKRMARLQKQSQYHNVIYQLRGLEEYIKKQILIVNNRMNQIQLSIIQDKKKRPWSAHKTGGSDGKLSSTVSYKKLIPVNCISCFPTNDKILSSDRKSSYKKFS